MVEPTDKEALINKIAGVEDTKVCLIYILTLKRALTPTTASTDDDNCLLRTRVLHGALPWFSTTRIRLCC